MTTRYTFKALINKIRLFVILAKYRLQGYKIYIKDKSKKIGYKRTFIADFEKVITLNYDITVSTTYGKVVTVDYQEEWVRYKPIDF